MKKDKNFLVTPDTRVDSFVDGVFNRFNQTSKAIRRCVNSITINIMNRTEGLRTSVAKQEIKISQNAAQFVNWTDEYNEIISERFIKILKNCNSNCIQKFNLIKKWVDGHKKLALTSFVGCTALAVTTAILLGNMTAYEYMYNGKALGIVKNQQDVYSTIDIIEDKLSYNFGADVKIDKDENISFRKVVGWDLDIDDQDKILNTLTYLRDMSANAYAIVVNGKQVAVLDSKESARKVLQTIKSKYTVENESIQYKSIDFMEKVSVEKTNTQIKNIKQEEEALEYMLTGAVEKKTYVVQPGETFYDIAVKMGLKEKELLSSNPNIVPEKLQIGEELILNRICPVVTVQTRELVTYVSKIDYDIIYEETSTLYKGENTVKSTGTPGERKVVAEIIRNNGEEVNRSEISSEVVKEPQNQVVLKGTKNKPKLVGSGKYIYPTRGRLSSRFGPRWGRMHYGIDLAAPTGTKIRASDGGTVIFAGRDGSYGNVVKISHGGNRVTIYAHCSKLFVSKGSKVYQGQHIANVGNTGNSTGSHLHFEVRINGVAQNPLKYLK
ncbi:MAG: peptidoglycan DD-metalloendopeptidase family protein [Anaerovoracaceae bacterium]|jgi:murein DD-endopeptidase MepM/ murein hydrolase activator NlpD